MTLSFVTRRRLRSVHGLMKRKMQRQIQRKMELEMMELKTNVHQGMLFHSVRLGQKRIQLTRMSRQL
jgi:hypothetical protein